MSWINFIIIIAAATPKPARKKLDKRVLEMGGEVRVDKMSTEELMESGVYQRFNRTIEKIFDAAEENGVGLGEQKPNNCQHFKNVLLFWCIGMYFLFCWREWDWFRWDIWNNN